MAESRLSLPPMVMRIGFWMALVLALVTAILWAMDLLPKEQALVILAICAVRL